MSEQEETVGMADPGVLDFDVDAWLAGAQAPRRSVIVYGAGALLAEAEELAAVIKTEPPSAVLGGSKNQKRLRELREQIEASRRVLHVRALEDDEREELLAMHTKPSDDGEGKLDSKAYEEAAYTLALVKPEMTADQVAKLRKAIGPAQWAAIGTAITRASVEDVSAPLSQLGSEDTQDS